MKKSKEVPATLIVTIAAIALAGCSGNRSQVRRCVDNSGNVMPDSMCSNTTAYTTSGGYGNGSGYYSRSHWIYGGTFSGNRVSGGSTTMDSGADVVDGSGHTISRGGFGGGTGGGS